MKKSTTTYHYTGPIKRFGKTVVANWSDETQAVSEAQALNNLKYKAKKYLKLTSDAKVELNPNNLIKLDGLDEEETREYNRSYDPDYDIPDEMEEMYGGNIFMKDSEELVKVHTSDEHTGSYPNYFGYMLIEHPNLGDFYVSFSVKNSNVRTDGYPWKFLLEPKYKLNKRQRDWVMNHKDELSLLSRKVSGTIKLEDNFCTLNPGTVKLRRASKKFNQRDCDFKDSKIKDSYIKMDAYDLRDIFGRYYDKGLKERYNLNVSEDDFCYTGTTKVTGAREDLERFVREHFDNNHYHSNIYSLKSIKDWMPTKTPIDYITEKLDRAGIEYEIEDDVYGESAPFDTWITITRGSDSRADDIICSVVGSAYEWVRDRNGNRLYCKVVTDEDLIEEFNN